MTKLQDLRDEIDNDPLAKGYAGMTDLQVADSLNAENRTVNKSSLSGDQLFSATDSSEFGVLSDHKEQLWIAFCGRDSIDPFSSANVSFVQYIFGGGSNTVSNLNSLRTETVSRASELGVGGVREGTVQQARSL